MSQRDYVTTTGIQLVLRTIIQSLTLTRIMFNSPMFRNKTWKPLLFLNFFLLPSTRRGIFLDLIVTFLKNKYAVENPDSFVTSSKDTRRKKETKNGYQIQYQRKGGSMTWNKLKDVKNSYHVAMVEFEVEPNFSWWIPYTFKKKTRFLYKINSN